MQRCQWTSKMQSQLLIKLVWDSPLPISSHVLVVEGLVNHYRWLDHGPTQSTNPALFLFVGLRIEVECCPTNVEFLNKCRSLSTWLQSCKSARTYKAVFFVDLIIWRLDSAAGVHLDTLCWVRIVPTLPVRQQVVLGQNCVSPTSINKDNKEELASTTMMTTRN